MMHGATVSKKMNLCIRKKKKKSLLLSAYSDRKKPPSIVLYMLIPAAAIIHLFRKSSPAAPSSVLYNIRAFGKHDCNRSRSEYFIRNIWRKVS